MDERHWWIASKVEQTFCIDKTSSTDASFTETFFRRPDVLSKINSFLFAKGSNKLFFYTTRDNLYAKEIICCNNIIDEYTLVNESLDNLILLFFIRSDTSSDATISPVSDIYSGEIKHPTQMTSLLYSQTLLTLFKKELTANTQDSYNQTTTKTSIITQMEKQIDGITATCHSLHKDKNLLLKRADAETLHQLKQTGRSTTDSPVIRNCETLVLSWITTIENVLQDIFGEDSIHPSLGPLSEIERWTRKQRLINNLLEQLKSKECKAIIGALITSKSKVIRKWKAIDVSITEAQNECRDKTKFLESIRRYLENLTEDAHPQNCAVNILPALCDAMRTVESVSRYYARQGYLGWIFSKVTNQLVKICKHHMNNDDITLLWPKLFEEIQTGGIIDDIKENFHLDKRDIKRFREVPKGSIPLETNANGESTFQRLKNCLLLLASYKETFRTLRDALGGVQMLATTAFSSASSTVSGTTSSHTRDLSQSRHQIRRSSGILMSEDEKIFQNLEDFCHQIEQMLDMTITLNQFSQLISSTIRLPKPKRKDIMDAEQLANRIDSSTHKGTNTDDNNLENTSDEGIDDGGSDSGAAPYDYLLSSVSKTDLELIKKHYDDEEESLPLNIFLANGVEQLKSLLTDASPSNDEETNKFDSIHKQFTSTTRELEHLIGAYINVMFSKTKRTQEGLAILASFEPICERNYLRPILRDAYVNLFLNFENDLMDIRTSFEAQKDDPPLPRNAPPIAGAIAWSRTLLTKMEQAMDVFKTNRHITAVGNFSLISKLYNHTAKTLLVYEQLLLTRWKEKLDVWKDHLNTSLLCLVNDNDKNRQIEINSNLELFSIFDEVKWFKRLDVDIPKAALVCIQKEQSFKQYKSLLEDLLKRFYDLQAQIYPPFYSLFTTQLTQVYRAFEPGLHTINWSNLNIDAFIAKVHRALDRFETFILNINNLIAEKIDSILDNDLINSSCLLFSPDYIHSKLWSPIEFYESISVHVNEQAILIGKKLFEVQQRFQEVEDMVKVNSSQQKSRSSTSSTTRRTKTPIVPNEAMITFIRYYHDKMISCIQKIIERSLHIYLQLASVSEQSYLNDQKKLVGILFEGESNNEQFNPIDTERIRIGCIMQYAIPEISIDPELILCQKCIRDVAYAIINCEKRISESACFDNETARRLTSSIGLDPYVTEIINRLSSIDIDVTRISENAVQYIRTFDFLWHDDSQLQYQTIIQQDEDGDDYTIIIDPNNIPTKETRQYLQSELERLVQIEDRLNFFPHEIQIGCVCIETIPIINSLRTFIFSWKSQYAKLLHRFTKTELDQVVTYRQQIQERFNDNVSTLEQLDEALILLEELSEMENKIDSIYLPIETTYSLLTQVYNIPIPRDELQECSQLRDKWSALMLNADRVRKLLLQERRQQLEQELDKQVKSFVVEVIRFRNAFDVEGPNVPDLPPLEAAKRLRDFQEQYRIMHRRKQTLNSISTLFSLQPKQFPELDKTGEELLLLDQLYILYKKYIAFDTTFRNTLWSEVDLIQSQNELNDLWTDFCNLPTRLQERIWTAYYDLEGHLKKYRQLFPILFMLNAREIRSRHWLKVMQITGCQFQLESSIFKLNDLLEIPLDKYQDEISAVCFSAQKELELEVKMRSIEEEWTEQILNFEPYKDYGSIVLEKRYVEHLLEHLEDGEEILAQMLTTRYIEPMREEVASWSDKLKTIGEILELWLEVQDMWLGAESIFNNPSAGKDISLESKRFVRVDKTWLKTQRQSAEVRNVLQCCLSEPPKKGILREMQKELEICNKSIALYLDRKRQVFPRFYFLTNRTLISLLSRQDTISYIKPHFHSLFNGIHDLKITVTNFDHPKVESGRRSAANGDSRSHIDITVLTQREIEQVISDDGECMQLVQPVPLEKSVEQWLAELQETVGDTIRNDIASCIKDLDSGLPFEELVSKYTCQVSLVGLLYSWTREIETGMMDAKTDRKGLHAASKRFLTSIQKMPAVLTRSQWKTATQPVLHIHKLRLEGVLSFVSYLRDNIEIVCSRRRDLAAKDFDWRRCFRVYQATVPLPQKSERKSTDSNFIATPVPAEPVRMQVLDDVFTYGSEFYGVHQTLCITPTTEKCFLGIWVALSFKRPVLVQGKQAVGKMYTITSLAHFLGRFVATFECSQHVDPSSVAMFITGLATDGCWGVFHNIHTLPVNVISTLAEHITTVCDALRANNSSATIISENREITILPSVGILATRNPFAIDPNNDHRIILSLDIRSRFRMISLVKPEIDQIFRIKCFEHNLKNPNNIAEKLSLLYETIRLYLPIEQRSIISLTCFLDLLQYVNNLKKRSNSRPNSMTSSTNKIDEVRRSLTTKTPSYTGIKSDQLLLAQLFIDVIGARLDPENAKTFRTCVLDIFVGRDESKMATMNMTSAILEKIISDSAPDHDFIPKKLWISKCTQMIHAANVSRNMILCGSPYSGKSSAAILMLDILTQMQQQQQLQSFGQQQKSSSVNQEANYAQETAGQTHKLYRINPLAIESESILLGYQSLANEWQDGILTTLLRKANRNCHTSWFCFDGIISRTWADLLPSILERESSLQIRNGDKLYLLDQVKFMFETSDLTNASPTFIANSTVIYFDKSVIDWKVIAGSWLKERRQLECLRGAFDRVMDPILTYLQEECPRSIYYSEMSLFSITLRLLDAILNENTHITTDVHIERFFIFCLTFVLKIMLNPNEQKGYSDLLKTVTAVLPDDDREISVFDYYVDEACEWDLWTAKVEELNENIQDRIDIFGNVLVQTVDLARAHYFLKYAALAQVNILFSGTTGSCKTFLIDTFVNSLDTTHFQMTRSNFSKSTNSADLQKIIEANVVHRQGFTYGAPLAKKLCLFIDDLQASATSQLDRFKNAPEFLRTLIDHRQFLTQQKPYETRIIDDLFVFATATIPLTGEQSLLTLSPRLLRHFAIVNLPANETSLRHILTNVIDINMMGYGKTPINRDISTKIVDVLMDTLRHIQRVLQPSSVPGREHYLFSLRNMLIPIQSLRTIDVELRNDKNFIASFLKHELFRIIYDQLTREMDQYWFTDTLNEIFRNAFDWTKNEEDHRYITFPIDGRSYERPLTSLVTKEIKLQVQQMEHLNPLHKIIEQAAIRYKEELGHNTSALSVSESIALHIIRMHRILSHPTLNNLFVMGTVGSHLSKLVRLAFYFAEIQEYPADYSNRSLFYDSLKTVIRTATVEGRHIGVLLTYKHLRDSDIIDDISSLLTSGECPNLFSGDELEGLYQAVVNAYQRDHDVSVTMLTDPRQCFLTRVRQNLHIAICLPAHNELLKNLSSEYPGLLKHTQVYWIKNWSKSSLYTEASYFLSSHETLFSKDLHERLSQCLCDIHYFMLEESRQIPFVGSTDRTILIRENSINQNHPLTSRSTSSKEQVSMKKNMNKEIKTVDIELPNYPYSRILLHEQIKNHGSGKVGTTSQLHTFIGPETFTRFMESFWYLFTSKAAVCERDIIRLTKVLNTLHKTRQDAENMKDYIQQLKERCSESEKETAVLLEEVIYKSMVLEKLRAKYVLPGCLPGYVYRDEKEDFGSSDEDKKALLEDEADEYELAFKRMKDESLRSRQVKMQEEHDEAVQEVEQWREKLAEKRKEVEFWMSKVDKSCIERIRTFQTPPILIGTIMEMVLILIGRKSPLRFDQKEQEREKGRLPAERLDRHQWKQYTAVMADITKFVDILHGLDWQDGLNLEISNAVESFIAKGKDGISEGITGEGTLLENAKNFHVPATRATAAQENRITLGAARYASEEAAILVHYAIALVEYTKICQPLCVTKAKVDQLKQDLIDAEQKRIERETEIQRLKLMEETLHNADISEEDSRLVDISPYTLDDIPRLLNQLEEAQIRFDTAAVKKNKLKKEYESCQSRLQAALNVTLSLYEMELFDIRPFKQRDQSARPHDESVCLSDLEDQWAKWIAEHSTHDQTLTNCILAAAYMTYCSALDADLRRVFSERFTKFCEQYEIPRESDLIFQPIPIDSTSKNSFDLSFSMINQSLDSTGNTNRNNQLMTLAEFLYNPIELKELQILRLIPTDIMTENGCIIMADAGLHAWPLIYDTTWYSIDYIRLFLKNKKLLIVRHHQLRTQLENALSEGHHLLLTDCDTNTLMSNEKLETVIRNQARFISSEKPFKLQIGQQEIECSPKFRLYLHTTTQPVFISKELAAYTLILNFHLTLNDLEEIFLSRFMLKEKPHIDSEQYTLLQEKVDTLKIIDPLRQNITNYLASDTINLLQSVEPTKRLSELKKAYDEATEGSKRVALQEESLFKTRNSYRKLALRAATCYNTLHYLQQLIPDYVMPLEHFLDLFDTCIFQSEKHSMNNVMTDLTKSAYITIYRMLNDRDRRVFSIYFAMEIEAFNRRQNQQIEMNVPSGEREFIVSPVWATALLQKRTARASNEHRFLLYKKPFDWMTDEAFQNLQYLAMIFDWFADPFDRMVKEVQEVKWRPFCEGDTENCTFPPPLEQLEPIQKFCVVRAVRSDRILQASTAYIANVFQQDSNKPKSVAQDHQQHPPQQTSSRTPTIPVVPTLQQDVDLLLRQSSQRAVLLLYDDEPDEVINFFNFCTNSIPTDATTIAPTIQIINVYGNGAREERILKKTLKNALTNNVWLLFHGLHNSPSFLTHVELSLWELRLKRPTPMPRIWLSIQRSYSFPSSLYNLCLITYIRTPFSMKEGITRAFSAIDNDLLRHSSKSEWLPLLHNICYLHSTLNLRTRYNQAGWDIPSLTTFTNVELTSAFQVVAREFALSDQSTTRLESGIPNATISNEINIRQLSWSSMRYTLSELIYGAKALSDYDQRAIANIVDFWIQPGSVRKDFEYSKIKYKIPSIFFTQQPKLSQLLQAIEALPAHQFDVPEACHLHSSFEANTGDDIFVLSRLNRVLDALPSNISLNASIFQRPNTPIEDITINTSFSSSSGLWNSLSSAALYSFATKKNAGLDEYCASILTSKLPKVLTKDQILDRARRNGSPLTTPFNIWIVREAELMTDLVNLIRNHVQVIKTACELNQLGVHWSDELANVAHALHYQRIPDVWCDAIGLSAPPPVWGLTNFFNDLNMRAEHIEKLLTKGREKHPAFNLSAFFNASSLFGIYKQEVAHALNLSDDTNNSSLVFQCELTPRDREHIREAPKDGFFIYGLYLWGCSADKNTVEHGISDAPTKNREGCSTLPVIHLTCVPTEKTAPAVTQPQTLTDTTTGPSRPTTTDTYACPVFPKRFMERRSSEVICELELWKKVTMIGQASRWAWRGVCMTVKPY